MLNFDLLECKFYSKGSVWLLYITTLQLRGIFKGSFTISRLHPLPPRQGNSSLINPQTQTFLLSGSLTHSEPGDQMIFTTYYDGINDMP